MAVEIKTLNILGDVIKRYREMYNEDCMEWLIIDLETQFPTEQDNWSWGVYRKWRSLTPNQRIEFCDQMNNDFLEVYI